MPDTSKLGEQQAGKPSAKPSAKPSTDSKLEAEMEEAAAQDEPMGSVAAAVPGDDAKAEDAAETGARPGAESRVIRDQPQTTAGTEAKLKNEEPKPGKAASGS